RWVLPLCARLWTRRDARGRRRDAAPWIPLSRLRRTQPLHLRTATLGPPPMALPVTGRIPLLHADRHHNRSDITVHVVRSLDDLQKVNVLRALTYMAEQACPYEEEFDGNDLCALHLLANENGQPAGSLRLRFFNGFCKIERVCIDPRRRGGAILNFL